jgi:hypothetical protein
MKPHPPAGNNSLAAASDREHACSKRFAGGWIINPAPAAEPHGAREQCINTTAAEEKALEACASNFDWNL